MFSIVFYGMAGAVIAACAVHFAIFGRRRGVERASGQSPIYRFSLWERAIHLITVVAFAVLACTGLLARVGFGSRLSGWLWVIHLAAAALFAPGVLAFAFTWARDGRFASHDWGWVRYLGGYLEHDRHVPAGRLNAGQKGYFWGVGLLGLAALASGLLLLMPIDSDTDSLILLAHRYVALFLTLSVLGHIYLGTFGNPGTFLAMITGWVDRAWAQRHHPIWEQEIRGDTGEDGAAKGTAP